MDVLPSNFICRKKKSDKSKSKTEKVLEHDRAREAVLKEDTEGATSSSGSGSHRGSPSIVGGNKTEAERRFEEIQRRRVRNTTFSTVSHLLNVLFNALQLAERVKKLADKTHKDRVHEFNSKLEALSEHHDIPKVMHSCFLVFESVFIHGLI